MKTIKQNVKQVLDELPEGVQLVAAAKTRSPQEILEAIDAGVKIIGENYIQEAETAYKKVGNRVKWHFIGHLQRNKVKKAVSLFDMIETVDSVEIARQIDKHCQQIDKVMPVLIEVNSGKEKRKTGILPEGVRQVAEGISTLPNLRLMGLMTMGPRLGNPEESRSFFVLTRKIFEELKGINLPDAEMKYLSMGMTNSYRVALSEGANIIRLGTRIFGERED